MRSSYPISLFSGPPQADSGPSAFVVSIVVHSCLFSVLFLSMRHVVVVRKLPVQNYSVRLLEMRRIESQVRWFPQKSVTHHSQSATRHSISAGGKLGLSSVSRVARISRNFRTDQPAPHTMIQPEVPPDQRLLDIHVPQAMVWTPGEIAQRKIVTPEPQPVGAIQVKPSLKMPNRELNPTEVSLSSTPFTTLAPVPAPGTTSPVDVDAAQPARQLPETVSKDTTQISPARVISLSDLKMDEGTAALPEANEVAASDTSGSPTAGETGGGSKTGHDATDSKLNGAGAGHGAGNAGDKANDGFTINDGSNDSGTDAGYSVDTGEGSNPSSGTTAAAVAHITQPKTGSYGMVVVGASPEENYPETANLWAGRMVYTVYLQTDTAQNWILQYSLLRTLGDDPSNDTRPEAPWPYDMMRPNLGSYKDIVLVHGFVNTAGRFEQLSIVYPPEFREAALLLRSLRQWAFRPAMNQGQPATVEVLLIIPGATTD